jgi:REP element-mobilizing transposase RayT
MTKQPGRRSIRLKGFDYSQPGAYFVTICVQGKEFSLGTIDNDKIHLSRYGQICRDVWKHVPSHFPGIYMDTLVLMPNHLHVIITILESNHAANQPQQRRGGVTPPLRPSLGQIVGYYKYQTTKEINRIRGTPGTPFWQRNYYERVVRNQNELDRIRKYIVDNPRNWDRDRNHPSR